MLANGAGHVEANRRRGKGIVFWVWLKEYQVNRQNYPGKLNDFSRVLINYSQKL